ncbi:hypothetical protein AYM02_02415 [Coxiella burnetii]|uniref:Uncharacterized protein n=1 Tax=Coxiella burnetii (strain Dugway 5J108-111) TaxID=434922 RepID=A9KBA9_COXBN|nr:hypothetical protein CBUD_0122 [Coxiella burnetii Dugway 5J108-111]AML48219.1 hypothetical protein AUR58_02755 [Coxiella burnetii]AML54234.1 hypothetical protein AYM38_02385 [Coxiella burnetii]ARK28080.1 hypothetical protein BMW92_09470 [Coxiella burnetii]ATN68198.1 hypothetical protein AYM00_02475 [Coxiella burnetii]
MFHSRFDYPARVRITAVLITHFAALATAYCFFLRPQLVELHYLKQSLQEKQHHFSLTKNQSFDKTLYEKAIKKLKAPLDDNQLITTITLLCQKNHLQLIHIEPKKTSNRLGNPSKQFNLFIQGNFLNMITFLKKVLRLPHLLVLSQLQIQKKNDELTLQCTIEVFHD